LNYHPDLAKGRNDVLALMFDMNDLWEKYVLVCLRREGNQNGFRVSGQRSKPFWKPEDGRSKIIKPDIIIEYDDEFKTRKVLDTKWKNHIAGKPDDGDLKQLYVYNQFWESIHSFLVYPGDPKPFTGSFHHITGNENASHCHQIWISVLREDKKGVDKELGKRLMDRLEESENKTFRQIK